MNASRCCFRVWIEAHLPRTGGRWLDVALVALLFAATMASALAAEPASAVPRIVFILADDLGPGDLGCYGGTQVPTPNLDRLAREGTRFTQYYSAAPICSPSRAGLLTGQFPGRWRITSFLQTRAGNRACGQADFLDPAAPSLPRVLKAAGYATAHFGKWHLGGGRDVTNAPAFAQYGYDEHAGTYESPEPHPDITGTNWIWSAHDKVKRWDRTRFFVDKTIEFLARRKTQRCFVNLWLDDPHTPWVPRADSPSGPRPANLRGVLIEMDRQVGRLLDGLRDLGLERDTLVIFASDNGALPTFQGRRSGGLRGGKLSLYEGGIRLPFIARWPGRVPSGRVDDQTVLGGVDLLPTLAAMAHARMPDGVAFDGENMSAVIEGKPVTRAKPLFWEYGRNEKSFSYPGIERDRSPNLAMRDGRWKLLVNADGSSPQLFDVVEDRSETRDLAGLHPDEVKRLTKLAVDWRKSLP